MTGKKQKFSFFDLSDDESFGNITKSDEKENVVVHNEPVVEKQEPIQAQQVVKTEPQQVVQNNVSEPIAQPKQQVEHQDNFYGEVKPFVPSKKEYVEFEQEEVKEQIVTPIQQQTQSNQQNYSNNIKLEEPVVFEQPKQVIQNVQPVQKPIQQTQPQSVSNDSLNGFFDVKEKLDVKTNIYIKKWIYDEIEQIHKRTNISRSSVINKLLEHALKELNKK